MPFLKANALDSICNVDELTHEAGLHLFNEFHLQMMLSTE